MQGLLHDAAVDKIAVSSAINKTRTANFDSLMEYDTGKNSR